MKKFFSTSFPLLNDHHFKVVVCGGGSGGSSISNALGRKFGKKKVAVIEPSEIHYYQPMWTLIGAGAKRFDQCHRSTSAVLTGPTWLKDSVVKFEPKANKIILESGTQLTYDALVLALGLQLRYDMVKGLPDAFSAPGVCSNYHKDYVQKTLPCIENFRNGNAIFTFPQTSIKCPGAPQKIMYLAEENFRKNRKRDKARIMYCTAANFMFGVKAYNGPLEKICDERGIQRNYMYTLTEIKPSTKEAFFDVKDENGKLIDKKCFEYEMIHIGPPCSAPEVLRNELDLVDPTGYLDLNKETLQHTKYANIFGLGDCTNLPTSKTAAAAAVESGVLQKNIVAFLENKALDAKYDGYSSCPLVTGYKTAIMPEFDYSMKPLETLPIDQSKERRLFYWLKADLMPLLYWSGLVKGIWKGPKIVRKMLRFGFGR